MVVDVTYESDWRCSVSSGKFLSYCQPPYESKEFIFLQSGITNMYKTYLGGPHVHQRLYCIIRKSINTKYLLIPNFIFLKQINK